MKIRVVLNREGGALSTMNLDAFVADLRKAFTDAGHEIDIDAIDGGELVARLNEACHDSWAEVILVGGGDGTVSLAAGMLADSEKTLALLPAGTMNLFARSLGIPLEIDNAAAELAKGRVRRVDVARVNGRPFIHQFSIGMQPQLIHLRSRIPFRGRLGKLAASSRAALTTLLRPHHLKVALKMGDSEIVRVTPSLSVTNNLYGEGHLPFTDRPDGGVLGVYITRARQPLNLLAYAANMAVGRWRGSGQVEIHQAREVALTILSARRGYMCSIDGELCPLEKDLHIRLHPRSLKVLVPAAA